MAGMHFDATYNSEPVTKALDKIQKGIYETAKAAELAGGRIDAAFNRISLKGLERIHELMQGFPKEVQGFESFKKQMSDLEKRLEQANKKIIELQNQAKQPIAIHTNTSEVAKETFAYDSLLESLNDILGARGQNVAAILQEQNAIKLNQRELQVLAGIEGKGLKLSNAQQTRRIQLTNSIMQHKQAVSSLQQVVSNEIKLEESAKGSMDEMNQSLGRMRMAYRQLTEEERNSKFGQDLLKNIQGADAQIKQLDATIGNHARNIGDYKQQWNGLQYQMQMVARETPNFAINPQTGIISLTNNLPYLVDELSKASKAYKDYITAVKAGATDLKAVPSVGKQVLSSLLNWQTGLIMGITLITAYRKEITEWVGGLFNAKGVVKELVNAEQEMAIARKKAISDSTKERTELDLLYSKLKNATLSTKERNAAVNEWAKKYPQHSNIMNGELVNLGKLEAAYKSLSKQIIESAKARAYLDKITELESKKDDTLTKRQNQYVTYLKSIEERDKAVAEYDKKSKEGFGTATNKIYAQDKITRAEQNVNDQKQAWLDLISQTNKYDDAINAISKKVKVDDLFLQPEKGTYDYWQQQIQNADIALKQIDSKQRKLLNAGKFDKVDSKVVANYKEQKRLIAEAEKELKAYPSASDTTKQESAAETLRQQQEKYNLLMDKQTRDRVRAEEDAANEIRQAKIDADKDGAEKVLKQRELNHDKEIQAIAREADDRKRAVIDAGRSAFESAEDKAKAEDPKHVKKTFDEKKFVKSDDAIAEFLRINKVAQGKVDAENAKYNRGEDLKGLLDEYQDFADQRLAIEKKYNEDIKVLDAQRKTALENGDMEQVAKIDRSKVQAEKNKNEDLSGVSLEEFKTDIDWATLFGNLDVLSPESLNKLRDKLKAFIETAADKLKPEDLKVLSEAMTNVDLTIADKAPYEALKVGLSGYKVATGDAATAQEKLNKLQKDGKDGTQEYKDATKELTDAQRRRAESLKTVTQAANNIGSKGMEVVNAGNEIVGMLENFGVEVPEAVGKTLDGIGQVMSGLESLDLTKPFTAITGAISILSGIGNTIAGLLGFGKENKTLKDTQRLEETTNRLAETEKVINSFIEKRIELLKDANIEEQKNIATTTQAAIDNQKKYYEQQLDGLEGNWLLAKAGKNNNLTLKDLGITSIKELEEFLSSDRLLELQKNGYSIRDAEKWQEIIDGNNSVLDKEKELQETMAKNRTGISLDEAQNALDDFIKDADSSFGDVADSFEDHMRNAMFNIVKQNYLNKAMEDWYKEFEKAMDDGALDSTEAGDLKKGYEEAYTNAQNRYLAALEAAGISAESDPSREATQKGIATASQESVDENNGRLTMIQGHTYSINESVTSINGNTAKIVENLACMTNISQSMKSILDMKDIELTHLSNISNYTENLVEMKQYMYAVKQGIDTLNTKGLTLKR